MSFLIRPYRHDQDYDRVGQFLIDHYTPGSNPFLWIQPRWEYMHFQLLIKETDLSKIGVAEVDGEIAGVVHHEHDEGTVYFQVPHKFDYLNEPLFDYAEAAYGSGRDQLSILINETDRTLQGLAADRGYRENLDYQEITSRYDLEKGVAEASLPPGFRLQSLAEENDLHKINQVLWRGFNHDGSAPEKEIEGRTYVQEAPHYRYDLTIVAVAPNGDYVSFCGMWLVPQHRISYVEPVATDPEYRRMGLGKAVVLEGIRRTAQLGAREAWVGSALEFYKAIGFKQSYRATGWVRQY